MQELFKDRAFWIVGASYGIGRSLAFELSAHGAKLVLSGRDRDALVDLNEELASKHRVVAFDVSEPDSVRSAYQAIETFGIELDSLIYLAGVYEPTKIGAISRQNIRSTLTVNFEGAVNCVQAVLPKFIEQNRGQLVLCGSLSAYRGLPRGQPYSGAKAALVSFAESLKAEVQSQGIDVRLLSPGFVKTRLTAKNNFEMPGILSTAEAAKEIVLGLQSNKYEIRFPRMFSRKLKMLKIIPDALYFKLVKRIK